MRSDVTFLTSFLKPLDFEFGHMISFGCTTTKEGKTLIFKKTSKKAVILCSFEKTTEFHTEETFFLVVLVCLLVLIF